MFEKAADIARLIEGRYEVAVVKKTLLLIVWPEGGQPKAFQALCPHEKEPLADGRFDGQVLECRHHDWRFDGTTGKCLKGKPCQLAEYPSKIENGALLVDVDGVTATYLDNAPPKLAGEAPAQDVQS